MHYFSRAGVVAVLVAVVAVIGMGVAIRIWEATPPPGDAAPQPLTIRTAQPNPAASSAATPLPRHPRVVFLGDSWTEGYTATPGHGYPEVLSRKLHWDSTLIPRGAGTGYLNVGETHAGIYLTRLAAARPDSSVALVIIQGGLNDQSDPRIGGTTALNEAASAVIAKARSMYPHAQVLVLGPLSPLSPSPAPALVTVDDRLRYTSSREKTLFVSPLEEHWFRTADDISKYVDPTTIHPNNAGHAYFAGRFAADLKKMGLAIAG